MNSVSSIDTISSKNIFGKTALLCRLLLIVLLSVVAGCTSLLFYPQKTLVHLPSDGQIAYRDVFMTTADSLTLHAWLLTAEQPKGVVLFLHGNAENISTHIASVYWLPEQGYDVLLLDYRGFGRSQGRPGLPEVYLDIDAAYRWVQTYSHTRGKNSGKVNSKEAPLPVFVLAQSLGAALGSYYFSHLLPDQESPEAIVFDGIFASYDDISRYALSQSWLTWPVQMLGPLVMPDTYDPVEHIGAIRAPSLFFHSADDRIIPRDQSYRVYLKAREPKKWVETRGPHIATFLTAENRQILLDFLADPEAVAK